MDSGTVTPKRRPALFLFAALLALGLGSLTGAGCGTPDPAPVYPSPEDPALVDTEYADLYGLNDDDEAVEDDWVDPNADEEWSEPSGEDGDTAGGEATE